MLRFVQPVMIKLFLVLFFCFCFAWVVVLWCGIVGVCGLELLVSSALVSGAVGVWNRSLELNGLWSSVGLVSASVLYGCWSLELVF